FGQTELPLTVSFERCYVPGIALLAGVAKLAYAADSKASGNGDSATSKTCRNLPKISFKPTTGADFSPMFRQKMGESYRKTIGDIWATSILSLWSPSASFRDLCLVTAIARSLRRFSQSSAAAGLLQLKNISAFLNDVEGAL